MVFKTDLDQQWEELWIASVHISQSLLYLHPHDLSITELTFDLRLTLHYFESNVR